MSRHVDDDSGIRADDAMVGGKVVIGFPGGELGVGLLGEVVEPLDGVLAADYADIAEATD